MGRRDGKRENPLRKLLTLRQGRSCDSKVYKDSFNLARMRERGVCCDAELKVVDLVVGGKRRRLGTCDRHEGRPLP